MRKLLFVLAFLLSISHSSLTQISEGGLPYSFTHEGVESSVPTFDLSVTLNLNNGSEEELDDSTVTDEDPIIGETFQVNMSPITDGKWEVLDQGDSLWRLQINASSGTHIMLLFDDFYLPEGAKLFVYSSDKQQVLGAFTSENNTEQRKFTVAPIKSQSVVLEYYKPEYVQTSASLSLKSIGLLSIGSDVFNDVNTNANGLDGFGASGSCMINAKCPQYDATWCNQRRSVAIIYRTVGNSKYGICTGTLLNNERNDGKPIFLTAFHCLDADDNLSLSQDEIDAVQYWVFAFNYQSSGCSNPINEPSLDQSVSGAILINANHNTDYALLQLNHRPAKNYGVYYSGWSNEYYGWSIFNRPYNGVCIHHPKGDIKKISDYGLIKQKEGIDKYGHVWEYEYHWYLQFTNGRTEKGSSGSALFDNNGYVVGQLRGGYPGCGSNGAYFGRFSMSWYKFGIGWALNPNAIYTNNFSTFISKKGGDEPCKENWYFASGNDLHTSDNVSFLNPSTVGTRMYDGVYNAKNNITAEAVTIQSNTSVHFEAGNSVLLKPGFIAKKGSHFVAKIEGCVGGCGNGYKTDPGSDNGMTIVTETNENLENTNTVENKPDAIVVYPNPNKGTFTVELPYKATEVLKFQIMNQYGIVVYESKYAEKKTVELEGAVAGLYHLLVLMKDQIITKKIIIQ